MPQKTSKQITFQTRLCIDQDVDACLDQYAALLSKVERSLFVARTQGENLNETKTNCIKTFSVTARQFNSCRKQLDGKILSKKELLKEQIKAIEEKNKKLKSTLVKLKKKRDFEKLHQKKRKFFSLQAKLEKLKKDQDNNKVRLCFGGKKLFRAQFHLEENGYKNHQDWLNDWNFSRNNSFFLVGSKDESCGNQTCQLTMQEDRNFSLKLRLPNSFFKKHIVISDITFPYGRQEIIEALQENEKRKMHKNPFFGKAINFRFKKDQKGWRLFITITQKEPDWITKKELGVIGIDINVDHLALCETDRFGNPIAKKIVPISLHGKNLNQKKAILGDASKEIADFAKKREKPLVLEKLDFKEKRASLKELGGKRYRRMLSSFAHTLVSNVITSRSYKQGVEVFLVNPAYTSIIGKIKFSARYGLSSHQAAALCIARRFLEFSERLPCQARVPTGKGHHLTFFLPVRNRKQHVWKAWGKTRGMLLAKLAAYFRKGNSLSLSPRKSTLETKNIPKIMGEIPIREPLTALLG